MSIVGVICSFPLGRLGWVTLWEGQDGSPEKGSAPALANPAKSKTKNPRIIDSIISRKWIREKTNPCSSVLSVFHFFDLCPCRRPGDTTTTHGINISVRALCPSACGDGHWSKIKHGYHRAPRIIIIILDQYFGFNSGFPWIRECLWHSLFPEKHLITFYRVYPIIHQNGSAPALARISP